MLVSACLVTVFLTPGGIGLDTLRIAEISTRTNGKAVC